jgi:nicotinamidase-related amidase
VAVLLIDVQERLFDHVERAADVLRVMVTALKGFQLLGLPLFVTEQYPQGLGTTVAELKRCLPADQLYLSKTSFSCIGDPKLRELLLQQPVKQWILMGIEAHVCILQTAKQLLQSGRQVLVLNDAISSRSIYDFSTAIAEMRDIGVRVSSTETVLFELLGNAEAKEFKQISALIKSCGSSQ